MQILIVSATLMEIAPFQQQRPALQYLVTGVGAPACMYALQEKLHQNSYLELKRTPLIELSGREFLGSLPKESATFGGMMN
jgi:hypothetical protein